MYVDFSRCQTKKEVLDTQAEYSVSADSLIEFCCEELSLTQEQLNILHEWRAAESDRIGRLARQRLSKLGYTYHVQPEVL